MFVGGGVLIHYFLFVKLAEITITTLTNAMMPTVNDEYGNKFELIITVKLLLVPLDTALALC